MQANYLLTLCGCESCIYDQENRGKNETVILGKTMLSLLITDVTILDFNILYQKIYKQPEFKEILTSKNINEYRNNPLLIRILRQKQLLNNGLPESFIIFGRIPEVYFRLNCYSIITNSHGNEIIHYNPKDHLKVLVYEMYRWVNTVCFKTYPHIVFVKTIRMISNISANIHPDEQHSEWLNELNRISFITKNQFTTEESRQFISVIYTKVHQIYMAM
jgi:hypothetical protein